MEVAFPLVSVCLITYNQEKYIAQTLTSILSQKTNFAFELVIGDDASTDGTYTICTEFEQAYPGIVKLESRKKNIGFIQNFYQTCLRCKGRYIAFCEGDDYWIDPDKLQKQVDFLESNPDYGLICSNICLLFQVDQRISESKSRSTRYDFSSLLCRGNEIATVSVCCRNKYVETFFQLFFNEYLKWLMGDLPLWLYISTMSKIKYMEEATSIYRVLPESASHSKNYKKEWKFQKSIYEISLFFKERYGLDSADDMDCFYKRFYLWMIATGNKKNVRIALSFWKKNRQYGSLCKGVMAFLFWKQEKIIYLISKVKKEFK